MKVLAALLVSFSLINSGAAFAQGQVQAQPPACPCKDCKCTVENNCGCRSGKGCTCGPTRSCCSSSCEEGR